MIIARAIERIEPNAPGRDGLPAGAGAGQALAGLALGTSLLPLIAQVAAEGGWLGSVALSGAAIAATLATVATRVARKQSRKAAAMALSLVVLALAGGLAGSRNLDQAAGLSLSLAALAGALVAVQRLPARTVLVVGDARFRSRIAALAEDRGRVVVAFLEPLPWSVVASERAAEIPARTDEVVVQSDLYSRMGDLAPEIRKTCGRLLVVGGVSGSRTWDAPFDHPLPPAGRAFKRGLDLVLAPLALLLAAPIMLAAALAVVLDSPGGAFFSQVRIGLDGRPFRILKFRSMAARNDDTEHRAFVGALISGDSAPHGEIKKLIKDKRVTRVGRFLRKTSIDELPQLLNVIRGEMSLVGPRPPLPSEVDQYSPLHWQRMRVKPGLTGLWQVSGRSNLNFHQMIALDIDYWQSWSARSELEILLRTPLAVITRRGAA